MKKTSRFFLRWILLFLLSSVIIFTVVRMMPVSPAEQMLSYYQLPPSEENIQIVEQKLGLDRPLVVQYFSWIGNFFRGDWGVSYQSHLDIKEQFFKKLPYSMAIGGGGLLIAAVFGFLMGFFSALHQKGICDRISEFLVLLSQTFPEFLMAVVIIYAIGVKLRIARFFTGDGYGGVIAATLITAVYLTGTFARVCKVHFQEQLQTSHVRFAVSRGFSRSYVLFHHGWRPALYGLLSAMIARFSSVIGGSSVLEFIFAIPGISYFLVDSMKLRDYSVLQTYILVMVIWMFLVHLILGIVLRLLDVRREEG